MSTQNSFEYPEWDYNDRAYSRQSSVKVREFTDRDPRALQRFEENFGNMSWILARSLGRFRARRKVLERRTNHGGKLNTRYVQDELLRLHAGKDLTQKVYDRRVNPKRQKLKTGMSTGLLLDQSGSTRYDTPDDYRRIDLIKYAALTLGRGISNFDEDFFAYAFHTHRSADPTILEELKSETEEWNTGIEERIAALEHTAGTDYFDNKDGAAIRFANERILQSPFRQKYLFLVTDGNPHTDHEYYKGDYAFEDTAKAMEEGKRDGVNYIYLTINPDSDADYFLSKINHTTQFCKRFSRMKDVVEGLTVVYEQLRQGRLRS